MFHGEMLTKPVTLAVLTVMAPLPAGALDSTKLTAALGCPKLSNESEAGEDGSVTCLSKVTSTTGAVLVVQLSLTKIR